MYFPWVLFFMIAGHPEPAIGFPSRDACEQVRSQMRVEHEGKPVKVFCQQVVRA